MDHSLSKVVHLVNLEKGLQLAYMSTNQSNQSLDSESFEYFKIRGDLEEVAIMKSVQNWISYSHEFFQIFPYILVICPC
jgi:beta-xylosidase